MCLCKSNLEQLYMLCDLWHLAFCQEAKCHRLGRELFFLFFFMFLQEELLRNKSCLLPWQRHSWTIMFCLHDMYDAHWGALQFCGFMTSWSPRTHTFALDEFFCWQLWLYVMSIYILISRHCGLKAIEALLRLLHQQLRVESHDWIWWFRDLLYLCFGTRHTTIRWFMATFCNFFDKIDKWI